MTEKSYLAFARGLVIQLVSEMATFSLRSNINTNSTGLVAKQLQ